MTFQYHHTLTNKIDFLLIGWRDFDGNETGVIYDATFPRDEQWSYFSDKGMFVKRPLETIAGWLAHREEMPELSAADAAAEYDEALARWQSPPTVKPTFDALDFILQAETEGFEDEADIIYGLTQLRDSGLLFSLQGSWQRMARAYGVI